MLIIKIFFSYAEHYVYMNSVNVRHPQAHGKMIFQFQNLFSHFFSFFPFLCVCSQNQSYTSKGISFDKHCKQEKKRACISVFRSWNRQFYVKWTRPSDTRTDHPLKTSCSTDHSIQFTEPLDHIIGQSDHVDTLYQLEKS